MASLPPSALWWWCWCTALWICFQMWASFIIFVSLGCSVTQAGWLFSKCALCFLSHHVFAALFPHLEDCLCSVSNSFGQSLTPLGLRCPWIQCRTQWQKSHVKVFIASFCGDKRLITGAWISCNVHFHKEGQERGKRFPTQQRFFVQIPMSGISHTCYL